MVRGREGRTGAREGVNGLSSASSRPTVLIVDDHFDLSQNIADWLSNAGYLAMAAADGHRALAYVRTIHIDVVVTDLQMPGMGGLDLLQAIKQRDERIQVIVLTAHATVDNAIAALRQGQAFDFLRKPLQSMAQLKESIDLALHRRRRLAGIIQDASALQSPALARLTPRERHILDQLVQGLDNRSIADQLCLSEKTVRNHLTQIYNKLGVTSRAQAIVLYQQLQ